MARILFTSRWGGVSYPPYEELNLALHVGDDKDKVLENRHRVDSTLYLTAPHKVMYMNQTHSTKVVEIEGDEQGVIEADALVTRKKNVGIAVLVADCLPLLIHAGQFTAAVHVGREGLINGIIENTLDYIARQNNLQELNGEVLPTKPFRIHATLGPSICGNCYTLQESHFHQIVDKHPWISYDASNFTIDIPLSAINKIKNWERANGEYLSGTSIFTQVNRCTFENEEYFSHRGSGITGRFAGIVVNTGEFN